MLMINVEICINSDGGQSVSDAVSAALHGGASTIELCAAMEVGGLTPERHHIREARQAFKDKNGLMVMIRPRAGDFCYASNEIQVMHDQIKMAAEEDADGVVFGVLRKKDNGLNLDQLNRFMETAQRFTLKSTFHRAFDAAADPLRTLDYLIEAGIDRVLTSGTSWYDPRPAVEGLNNLSRIIETAKGRIEIVIGGGVHPGNVGLLLTGLPHSYQNISVHAYSGAKENGITTMNAVSSLVAAANKLSDDQKDKVG